jgi:FkbM family methyltransferase
MSLGHKLFLDRRCGTEFWAFYSGRYDDELINNVDALLKDHSYFLDIGANVGFYSVAIGRAAAARGCMIVAFEPGLGNFLRLQQNIALNNLCSVVRPERLGLSSNTGWADLVLREDYATGSATGNASIAIQDGNDDSFQSVRIELTTLDAYWTAEKPIGVIKIDIEGHEDAVLEGGRNTILRDRPFILMEVNNFFYRRKGASLNEACKFLEAAGYTKWSENGVDRVVTLDDVTELENVWLVPDELRDHFCKKIFGTRNS